MKSIQRRFDNISNKNPYWSSYMCFVEAIKNQNFSKQTIQFWFNRLIDKDDYAKKEKKEVLEYLYNLRKLKI